MVGCLCVSLSVIGYQCKFVNDWVSRKGDGVGGVDVMVEELCEKKKFEVKVRMHHGSVLSRHIICSRGRCCHRLCQRECVQ